VGMVALVPRLVRQRREAMQAQKEAASNKADADALRNQLASAGLPSQPPPLQENPNLAALAPPM
jgi:hypothetical protein